MQIPKSILLTCTVNLGDVVLATSAAALIKQHYPDCKVSMLVKAGIEPILVGCPVLDEVLVLRNKAKGKSIRQMWQFVKEIKKRKFDMSISLDRKLRPAVLTLLARIPVRIGPDKVFDHKPSRITMLYNKIIETPKDFLRTHQSEIFQSIIRGALGVSGTAKPSLNKSLGDTPKVSDLMGNLPSKKYRIALCIRGTYFLKNWPIHQFSDLVDSLNQKYDAVFYIIGTHADQKDAEILCQSTHASIRNFCGKTSLEDLVGILRKSDLFITIDTGSMHVAAVFDVPTVGIFHFATRWRWEPLSKQAKAINGNTVCNLTFYSGECPVSPCLEREKLKVYPCVEAIKKEQVEKAATELLEMNPNL